MAYHFNTCVIYAPHFFYEMWNIYSVILNELKVGEKAMGVERKEKLLTCYCIFLINYEL